RPGAAMRRQACARTGTAPPRWQNAASSSTRARVRRAPTGWQRIQSPRSAPPERRDKRRPASFLALLAGFRFTQQISAVQRGVIISRNQRKADIGQHALDDPAEGRIFVAHMSDDTVARKP